MGIHRQSLKALRAIALAHCRHDHPDLALLARELGSAIQQHREQLQASLADLSGSARFARWPLLVRPRRGLRMVVMAWPANHASPVHDHDSRWGVEISLQGALEIETWQRDPASGELQRQARHWLGPGDAIWFDADESRVHRCRNLSRTETALSLHIYGGVANHPLAYEPSPRQATPAQPSPVVMAGPLG